MLPFPLQGLFSDPHAGMALGPQGKPTEILQAAEQAGFELASTGKIQAETLSTVSQPVIEQEEYRQYLNQILAGASE